MQRFDYVIVGGGSAGCVLASRLTEDPNVTVLLLEAGARDTAREIAIPAAFSKLFKGPHDWAFETEPEAQLGRRRQYWPRGKMLGGSSSMNAMLYVRGNRRDYDAWAANGCAGWSFEDVLPYFKKSEHNDRGASRHHGADGPLHVADQRDPNELSLACVEAMGTIGVHPTQDFNGDEQDGAGLYQVTQKSGARSSASTAFLKPALSRANLTVRTGAHATRVMFERGRATGVAFASDGAVDHAYAAREVVLCGGAIGSPQLLLLSGVGPADALRELAIPVVASLAGVGANLQDHLACGVAYECTKPITLASAESIANVARYLVMRRGPLTSPIAEAGAFFRTRATVDAPDLQLHFVPSYFLDHGFQNPAGHGFTLGATLLQPESRGSVSLRSSSPFDAPRIEANYLRERIDLETMLAGMRMFREVAASSAFDEWRGAERLPGASVTSDEALTSAIAQWGQSLYHPVGTCAMGPGEDCVVDTLLRVRGVEGLRVADASVMPRIVRGNTNAPTIMIAERAAAMLRDDEALATHDTMDVTPSAAIRVVTGRVASARP